MLSFDANAGAANEAVHVDSLSTWPAPSLAIFRGWSEFLKLGLPVRYLIM